MTKNEFNPDYRVPPSFTLIECISYFLKKHTNSDLEPDEWNELMNNRLKIDAKIAVELEKVFKISKQMWLNLQNNYDKLEGINEI